MNCNHYGADDVLSEEERAAWECMSAGRKAAGWDEPGDITGWDTADRRFAVAAYRAARAPLEAKVRELEGEVARLTGELERAKAEIGRQAGGIFEAMSVADLSQRKAGANDVLEWLKRSPQRGSVSDAVANLEVVEIPRWYRSKGKTEITP